MLKIRNRWSFVRFGWTQNQLACYNIRSISFLTQLSSVWTWSLAKCAVTIWWLYRNTHRDDQSLDQIFRESNDTFQIEFELFLSFPSFIFRLGNSQLWSPISSSLSTNTYVSQVWLSCHPHFNPSSGLHWCTGAGTAKGHFRRVLFCYNFSHRHCSRIGSDHKLFGHDISSPPSYRLSVITVWFDHYSTSYTKREKRDKYYFIKNLMRE